MLKLWCRGKGKGSKVLSRLKLKGLNSFPICWSCGVGWRRKVRKTLEVKLKRG